MLNNCLQWCGNHWKWQGKIPLSFVNPPTKTSANFLCCMGAGFFRESVRWPNAMSENFTLRLLLTVFSFGIGIHTYVYVYIDIRYMHMCVCTAPPPNQTKTQTAETAKTFQCLHNHYVPYKTLYFYQALDLGFWFSRHLYCI